MIMIITTVVTDVFQVISNQVFGSLLEFLPHVKGCEHSKPRSLDKDVSSICENDALHACRLIIWISRDSLGISE